MSLEKGSNLEKVQSEEKLDSSKDVLRKGNLFQVPHYFGVDVAELLSGTGNPTLPRLLVFMCEYILNNSQRVSSSTVILSWMNSIVDKESVKQVRDQFDVGNFYDCGSPEVVFSLLKTFFREMPTPLFPSTLYEQSMTMVVEHLNRSINDLRKNPMYILLIETLGPEVDRHVEKVIFLFLFFPSFLFFSTSFSFFLLFSFFFFSFCKSSL